MLNEFELIQQQKIMQRFYSRTTAAAMAEAASSKRPVGERMRVAIVGGGAAAMTSALHLAPLVDVGLIAAPIDVYPGDSPIEREIGVGVWSTALTPFLTNDDDDDDATRKRLSHRMVWDEMMHAGLWVGQVGYRTPQGSWLARSELPTFNHIHGRFENQDDMPGLLFLREADMLGTLRRAVQMEEEQQETIQVHPETRVEDIDTKYTGSWSSPLQLTKASSSSPTTLTSERDYHLIVAADGSHSILRRLYGGHRSAQQQPRLTGTNVFRQGQKQQKEAEVAEQEHRWKQMRQAEANAVEDRRYSVLRGNAPMTREETGVDGISFQTWGVGSSMRFATVPMLYPDDDNVIERQVWFATTSDPLVTDESDPLLRKERLMESFSSWHDPITTMMETTDAQDILMERAVAHRHCVDPVINTSGVLQELHGVTPPSRGPGPAMVFVGDSFMTVVRAFSVSRKRLLLSHTFFVLLLLSL